MEYGYYEQRIEIDTTGRYDVTPLFGDRKVFRNLARDLTRGVAIDQCTHVVGIEALGFPLGGYLAAETGLGFYPIRKEGKLPYPAEPLARRTIRDYSGEEKTFEMNPATIGEETRALVVDDWIETGAAMGAATELLEDAGATVEAISVVFAHRNEDTEALFERCDIHAIGTDTE